jgi:carbamoyl-phosphate synthase small subunit
MSAAYLLLEDGTRLDGDICGDPRDVTGEVVFNTAMTGYQESVTDPSYAGQIIVFT